MMMGECRGGRDIDDECYKRPPKDHAIRRSFPSHKFKTRGKDCNTSIMATISYLWNSDRAHIDSRQIPMSNELPSDDLRRHTSSPETSKFSPELLLNPTFSSTMYQLNDSSRHSSNVQRGPSRRLLRRASSSFVWQDYSTNFLRFTVGDNQSESHHRGNNCLERVVGSLHRIYRTNEFVILIIVSIILAKAYPPLGAKHVYPRITSSWIVVVFIFFLAGLGLKTEEFAKAFQRLKFNTFVQVFSFGVVSGWTYGVSRGLVEIGALGLPLADGMVMCSCLPMTISSVAVLTKAAGGDEAAAIFNSAFGNMTGVFISPVLMIGYLKVSGESNVGEVFYKIAFRVVIPVIFGQLCRKTSRRIVRFAKRHRSKLRQVQQYALVFLVYTVFCLTFEEDRNSNLRDIVVMIITQFVLFSCFQVIAWAGLKVLFPNKPKLRVMGLFGCTQKTVAMGVPLIGAIYENDPKVGMYTLPLLIYYPLQLLVGAFLIPHLKGFMAEENQRLGLVDYDSESEEWSLPKTEPSSKKKVPPQLDLEDPQNDNWLLLEMDFKSHQHGISIDDGSDTVDSDSDSDKDSNCGSKDADTSFERKTSPRSIQSPSFEVFLDTKACFNPETHHRMAKQKRSVRFSGVDDIVLEDLEGSDTTQKTDSEALTIGLQMGTSELQGILKAGRTLESRVPTKNSCTGTNVLSEGLSQLQLAFCNVDVLPTEKENVIKTQEKSVSLQTDSKLLLQEVEIQRTSDVWYDEFDGLSDLDDSSAASLFR